MGFIKFTMILGVINSMLLAFWLLRIKLLLPKDIKERIDKVKLGKYSVFMNTLRLILIAFVPIINIFALLVYGYLALFIDNEDIEKTITKTLKKYEKEVE